jgi:arginine N-succinyltransferase
MSDLDAFYALALQTGGGLTNLPTDRGALEKRLQKSSESYADEKEELSNKMYLLMLEDISSGRVIGTANIFSQLGSEWPFYSFRMTRLRHASVQLQKTLTSDVLHLVNDFDGATEVGGLFVDPEVRKGGAGRLLARARYLFIAQMRSRFANHVVAELRGFQDAQGRWPFWEAVGQHFFDMPFEEADKYNSLQGNQFIADLMPKYPIYVSLLPPDAQAVIGVPNRDGEAAFHMLKKEGFRNDGYIDIFDAGPTVHCETDALVAIKDSQISVVKSTNNKDAENIRMISAGKSSTFLASAGPAVLQAGGLALAPTLAKTLGVVSGDEVRHVSF